MVKTTRSFPKEGTVWSGLEENKMEEKGWHYRQSTTATSSEMVGRVEQARSSWRMKLVCVCHCGTKGVLRQKDIWGHHSSNSCREGSGVISCSAFQKSYIQKVVTFAQTGTSQPVTHPVSNMALTSGIKAQLWQHPQSRSHPLLFSKMLKLFEFKKCALSALMIWGSLFSGKMPTKR